MKVENERKGGGSEDRVAGKESKMKYRLANISHKNGQFERETKKKKRSEKFSKRNTPKQAETSACQTPFSPDRVTKVKSKAT